MKMQYIKSAMRIPEHEQYKEEMILKNKSPLIVIGMVQGLVFFKLESTALNLTIVTEMFIDLATGICLETFFPGRTSFSIGPGQSNGAV